MIAALVVTACIIGYLAIGWIIGARALPAAATKAVDRARHEYPALSKSDYFLSQQAQEAAIIALWVRLLFWPVALPAALVQSNINRIVEDADPVAQQRRIREQEARIRELERELGIGGNI